MKISEEVLHLLFFYFLAACNLETVRNFEVKEIKLTQDLALFNKLHLS